MSKVEFVIAGCFEDAKAATVQARVDAGRLTLTDLVELAGEDVVLQIQEATT